MAKHETNKKTSQSKTKLVTFSWIAGVVVLVYIIGLINPITGNYLKYPYYEFFCGRKPVVTLDFMEKIYYSPGMKDYKIINMSGGLYCTENDARAHGYSKAYGE